MYVEYSRDSPDKIHDLICELSKVTEYKGNIQKYISTEQLQTEIFKNIIANRIKFQKFRNKNSEGKPE